MSVGDSDTSSTLSDLEVSDGGIENGQEGVIVEIDETNTHQQIHMSNVHNG